MINLDELKKKAEAATTGFWFRKDCLVFITTIPNLTDFHIAHYTWQNDAIFAQAFSPAVCLELIAQLRKAEGALEETQCNCFGDADRPELVSICPRCRTLSELRGLGGGG